MKGSVFSLCLLTGTMAFGQSQESSGHTGGQVCAVWNDLAALFESEATVSTIDDSGWREELEQLRDEIYGLCTSAPNQSALKSGTASHWLSRADRAGEWLARLARDAVLWRETPQSIADTLVVESYRFQFRLNQIRPVAHYAVKIQTVEVVREVDKPCESASDICDDLLRPAIARWARTLGELTDNHDRANDAMREAVRIKQEARSVTESSRGLTTLVSDWESRLFTQLSIKENYVREWFGLREDEERILRTLATEMRSELSLCLR